MDEPQGGPVSAGNYQHLISSIPPLPGDGESDIVSYEDRHQCQTMRETFWAPHWLVKVRGQWRTLRIYRHTRDLGFRVFYCSYCGEKLT